MNGLFGGYLKADTATNVIIGAFVDKTDFITPETGITLAAADSAEVIKHGSGTVVDISGETMTAVTGADGLYSLALTAALTDTEGRLTVYIADVSECQPVRVDFIVVNANVFDSLFAPAATDYLQVDALQINGQATSAMLSTGNDALNADVQKINANETAADNLAIASRTMQPVTIGTGSTTTIFETGLTEATNDHYNGRRIAFATGLNAGLVTDITDYNGASKQLTCTAVPDAPANGDIAIII
jgi:hypothetical protein